MNFWKTSLITAFAFLGTTSAVVFSSCEENTCLKLKCLNGGSCTDGLCRCASGYEGAECETEAITKFRGIFRGSTECTGIPAAFVDSVAIFPFKSPNVMSVVVYNSVGGEDTIRATVAADGLAASYNGAPNDRNVWMTINANSRLTLTIEQTLNGTFKTCTFNGVR